MEDLVNTRHWDEIYQASPEERLSWYQSEPGVSMELIGATGLSFDAALIDAGGGASMLAGCLLDRGYREITVLDCSGRAMALCGNRLGPRAKEIAWITADIRSFRTGRRFRLWHDRAVFHFMVGEKDRRLYLDTLDACLEPDGLAIIGTFAMTGPEKCSRLPVRRYDAGSMAETIMPRFELISTRPEVHMTPSGSSQDFLFFTIRRRPCS
jgi:hypothetical protein